jgi:hypothetical protein
MVCPGLGAATRTPDFFAAEGTRSMGSGMPGMPRGCGDAVPEVCGDAVPEVCAGGGLCGEQATLPAS